VRRIIWVLVVGTAVLAVRTAAAQDGVQRFANLGRCMLDSGKTIEHCRVGYRTVGSLNAAHDNAVLMPTWLNGRTEDLLELVGSKPSDKRLIDTSRFYAVLLDAFSDGVSSSPSNSDVQKGVRFPAITVHDMVRAEYRVATEVLHLKHAHAVIGLSMGGEQTFEWSVDHTEFFDSAAAVIATPQLTSYDLLTHAIILDAIHADPSYKDGNYGDKEPTLRVANEVERLLHNTPKYDVERITRSQVPALFEEMGNPDRQDANDRVSQLNAIMKHDVLRGKTIDRVARESQLKWLIVVSKYDHLVYPGPALAWAKAAGAETYISDTPCGHLILDCDAHGLSKRMETFLKQ
jgi:homoserine O-acetyltransferase